MSRTALCLILCVGLSLSVSRSDDLYSGLDPDGFDRTVKATDDLYRYVNGRWLQRTEIPADKSNYGSFTALDDAAREHIQTIIQEAAENPTDDSSRKIGACFQSFMDEKTISERGLQSVRNELDAIQQLTSKRDVFTHLGHLQSIGIDGPVGFYVSIDAKNSSRYLAEVVQSGTTLPDRDYYLEEDEKYLAARVALKDYIQQLFELAELPDGKLAAESILEFETELARIQWTRTDLRDAEKQYNKYEVGDLRQLIPGLPWPEFLEAVGVPELREINVMTPSYFQGLGTMGKTLSLEMLKRYLAFRVLDASAEYLPKPFADASFQLHHRQLAGVPEQQPRWKRAVDFTSGEGAGDFGVLGEAVGQLYVARHFKPAARERMDELVRNLLKAYEMSIQDLTWMTDETKQKALAKLALMTPKIGYPVKWRDYSMLELSADDLIGNARRSAEFEHQRMLRKLDEPVDKQEWGMTPQTVNAYYNPSRNEIVFPAAILQPPFFDAEADDAVNYGGIGAVIGHEISHGFDDQGSKYDGTGNLENWWTDADRTAFEQLTARLVEQFASYEALPGKSINGQLTLGENIADLSGLAIAWKAYQLSLNGQPGPEIDGHTAEQRFFLGWGQVWRRKYREAEMVRRLVIDPHSPSEFRANGPLRNLDAFHEAFDTKPGDGLYKAPEDRIKIW